MLIERSLIGFGGLFLLQNGLLDLKTLELKPFDADLIYTYKLNVRFDGSAECPKWLSFFGADFTCGGSCTFARVFGVLFVADYA